MGQAKRLLEDEQDKRAVATAICVKAKAFSQCSFHDEVYMNSGDEQGAFKLGNYLYKNEDWVSDAFETPREMSDYIQSVIADMSNDQCGRCEKLMAD